MLERAAVSGRTFRPGDVVQVKLEWRSDAPLVKRYKVFVQLVNTGGVLVAQRDSEPGGGCTADNPLAARLVINDQHGLALPSDLTPGDYQIIVGLTMLTIRTYDCRCWQNLRHSHYIAVIAP